MQGRVVTIGENSTATICTAGTDKGAIAKNRRSRAVHFHSPIATTALRRSRGEFVPPRSAPAAGQGRMPSPSRAPWRADPVRGRSGGGWDRQPGTRRPAGRKICKILRVFCDSLVPGGGLRKGSDGSSYRRLGAAKILLLRLFSWVSRIVKAP